MMNETAGSGNQLLSVYLLIHFVIYSFYISNVVLNNCTDLSHRIIYNHDAFS